MRELTYVRRGEFEMRPYMMTILIILSALFVLRVYAQDATPEITADQINSVARQLYCPVCENIPLDVCDTEACSEWRKEIGTQLQSGHTADQVIADFVSRYGDRVVGTPQDPTLRALSLVTPWIIALVIVVIVLWIFNRWWHNRRTLVAAGVPPVPTDVTDDDYRARLERDLQSRR